MAFPFLSEEGFEAGTKGHFEAQSPTPFTRMGIDHYSTLAQRGDINAAPWRGAYCLRSDLTNTTDHYIQETGSWDTNASGTIYFRMMVWFGGSPVMADADMFSFFQLWSGASTVEVSVGIQYTTASGYRFYFNETESATGASFSPCILNKWHCIEVKAVIDSGVGDDGTLDGWVDGSAVTQITALNQGAITSGIVGTVGVDATTTQGVLLMDDIYADDAQLYPVTYKDRFVTDHYLTASGHVFVGSGVVDNASLLSGAGTDNVLSIYDTDVAYTSNAIPRLELKNVTNSDIVDPAGVPVELKRGCYVALSGTNPRAIIKIGKASAFGSDGAVRTLGVRRTAAPINQ